MGLSVSRGLGEGACHSSGVPHLGSWATFSYVSSAQGLSGHFREIGPTIAMALPHLKVMQFF